MISQRGGYVGGDVIRFPVYGTAGAGGGGGGAGSFGRRFHARLAYLGATVFVGQNYGAASAGGGHTITLGQAVETDTAQPLGKLKTLHVGQAVETDTALHIIAAGVAIYGWGARSRIGTQVAVDPNKKIGSDNG